MDQLSIHGRVTTLIHFVYPVNPVVDFHILPENVDENETGWRIACMPGMVEFYRTKHHDLHHRTNEPLAVTCPMCKDTPKYKEFSGAKG